MSKMLVLAVLAMLSAAGQELPNATTSENKVVSVTPHGNGCKTLYYSSGAVSLECGGNIVRTNPVGTISCENMPNLCPPAKGVVGIQAERDLVWNDGAKTIHRPYVLEPGDVLKVYDRDLVPECHVVIVTFNKKTKFVKIDCKELYD